MIFSREWIVHDSSNHHVKLDINSQPLSADADFLQIYQIIIIIQWSERKFMHPLKLSRGIDLDMKPGYLHGTDCRPVAEILSRIGL